MALAVFAMLEAAPELFVVRTPAGGRYQSARELLTKYADQAFSYVDAVVLMAADDDRDVHTLLTVDSSLAAYAFSHPVAVEVPPR